MKIIKTNYAFKFKNIKNKTVEYNIVPILTMLSITVALNPDCLERRKSRKASRPSPTPDVKRR